MGHRSSALKFAYKAQSTLLNSQSSGQSTPLGLDMAINLLTFVLLWKVRKYREAYSYAQIAVNRLRSHIWRTENAYRAYLSLSAVVAMASAGCRLKVDHEPEKALKTLEDALTEMMDWEIPAERLVRDMKREVQAYDIDSDVSSTVVGHRDLLSAEEYTALVFITLFIPLISRDYVGTATPLIRRSDLETARKRGRKDQNDEFLRLISTEADPYSLIMTNVMSASKPTRSSTPLLQSSSPAAARIRKYRRKIAQSHDLSREWITPRPRQTSELVFKPEDTGRKRNKRLHLPLLRRELRVNVKRNLHSDFESARHSKGSESAPVRIHPIVPRPPRKRRSGVPRPSLSHCFQIERQLDISISPHPLPPLDASQDLEEREERQTSMGLKRIE